MPDYGRYCPISVATEVLADRWTPLIVRELILGNTRFNDIARGLPGISRSLLVQRLRHLERRGILQTWPAPTGRGSEYHLTPAGRDLTRVLEALAGWAIEWYFDEIRPEEIDPVTLTWWLHRCVDTANLPPNRVVIEFRHTAPDPRSIWMLLDHGEASVCLTHPGFDEDLVVRTSTPALSAVFNGHNTWARAVRDGEIAVDGPPRLVKALPHWFVWSPFRVMVETRLKRGEPAAAAG